MASHAVISSAAMILLVPIKSNSILLNKLNPIVKDLYIDRMQREEEYDQELAKALDSWGDDEPLEQQQAENNQDNAISRTSSIPQHAAASTSAHTNASQGSAKKQQMSEGSLMLALPRELQMRVWSFLSAQDLCKASFVCTAMRHLSEEQVLWRRLYCARWGKPSEHGSASWRAQYKAKDLEERRTGEDDSDPMVQLYRDMQRARRQQALGRGQIDDPMEVPRSDLQARLDAWRREYPPVLPGQPLRHHHLAQPQLCMPVIHSPLPGVATANVASNNALSSRPAPAESSQSVRRVVRLNHNSKPATSSKSLTGASPSGQPISTLYISKLPVVADDKEHSPMTGIDMQINTDRQFASTSTASTSGGKDPSTRPGRITPSKRVPIVISQHAPAYKKPSSRSSLIHQQSTDFNEQAQAAVKPDLSQRAAYTWDQIGDYWCCRETGWIHLCDHNCREGVIDPQHDLLVCPISCKTVDRMLSDCEVRALSRTGPVGHDEGDVLDFAGFIGRAYEAGYSCRNAAELRRRCFVTLG